MVGPGGGTGWWTTATFSEVAWHNSGDPVWNYWHVSLLQWTNVDSFLSYLYIYIYIDLGLWHNSTANRKGVALDNVYKYIYIYIFQQKFKERK